MEHTPALWEEYGPFQSMSKKEAVFQLMLTHIQYMYVCHFGSCVLLQGPEPNTLRGVEMNKYLTLCRGQTTLTFTNEI